MYIRVSANCRKIRSFVSTSRLGKKIYSFRGVRYAEPPTERRCFQIATPAADWNDVFDASNEGPGCLNLDQMGLKSKDCLRLNVYTGKFPSRDENVTRLILYFSIRILHILRPKLFFRPTIFVRSWYRFGKFSSRHIRFREHEGFSCVGESRLEVLVSKKHRKGSEFRHY